MIKKLNDIYRYFFGFPIEEVFREALLNLEKVNKEGNR